MRLFILILGIIVFVILVLFIYSALVIASECDKLLEK